MTVEKGIQAARTMHHWMNKDAMFGVVPFSTGSRQLTTVIVVWAGVSPPKNEAVKLG